MALKIDAIEIFPVDIPIIVRFSGYASSIRCCNIHFGGLEMASFPVKGINDFGLVIIHRHGKADALHFELQFDGRHLAGPHDEILFHGADLKIAVVGSARVHARARRAGVAVAGALYEGGQPRRPVQVAAAHSYFPLLRVLHVADVQLIEIGAGFQEVVQIFARFLRRVQI